MWHSIPLTLFWFVHMGSLGIFFPYFSLYLKENAGFSGVEIGWILAVVPAVSIVAQPLWGQIADRTGARSHIAAFLSLGSVFGYLWLAAADGFVAILFATAALSVFATAVLPTIISVSLAVLRDAGPHAFGFVRVWGTLGYLLMVLIFPWVLVRYQSAKGLASNAGGVSEPGLEIMFVATAALLLVSTALGLLLPRGGAVSLRAARGDWRSLVYDPVYRRFLVFSFCAYFLSHGPMWLFPIFIRARGGDVETIRTMWIYMLIVEIPLMLGTGSVLKRLGARGLLGVGVFFSGLRWILCAVTNNLEALAVVQILHGVTVMGLLVGGPLYLDQIAPEKLRSTAQGVLSMVGVGMAGIVSNLASGWLLDHAGVDTLYVVMGAGSVLLGALTRWMLPLPARSN